VELRYSASATSVSSDVMMSLEVQSQVVWARERSTAGTTCERFEAGVFAKVTSQLVGAREPPLTTYPRTPERTLAYTAQHSTQPPHVTRSSSISLITVVNGWLTLDNQPAGTVLTESGGAKLPLLFPRLSVAFTAAELRRPFLVTKLDRLLTKTRVLT